MFRGCLRREGKSDKLIALTRIASGLSADPGFAQRFDALMGEVANIVHPALCSIEDIGDAGGSRYVAAELVTGRDLGQIHAALCQRGEVLPPSLVGYIANQVADGLAAAHRATRGGQPAPLFHGELALSEILIGYDGNVRLTGLGSSALRAFVPTLARRGYRAPEVERGAACDARSDVFSLGACMYELLTGAPATRGDGHSDSAPLPRPQSHITRVVPRTLEPIVTRALADDPAARFQSAIELGRALRRWSIAQSTPGDARNLSAFLLMHFDAEREADEASLATWLGRVPADRASRVRSLSPARATRAVTDARATAPAIDAPISGEHARFDDPVEVTPPRGHLMSQLAATMAGADSPLTDADTKPPPADTDAEAEEARLSWDDETPAHGWISVSEEHAAFAERAVSKRAPAVAASKPAPAPRTSGVPVASARAAVAAASTRVLPAWVPPALNEPAARKPRPLVFALLGAVTLAAIVITVVATRKSPAPRSILQIQTHPAGAEIFVSGKLLGLSPLRRDDVASGSITLELRKQGFEPMVRTVALAPAQIFQLDVDLSSRKVEVHSAAIATAAPPPPAADTTDAESEARAAAPRASRASAERSSEASRRRTESSRAASSDEAAEATHGANDAPPVPMQQAPSETRSADQTAALALDDEPATTAVAAAPAPAAVAATGANRVTSEKPAAAAEPVAAPKPASRAAVAIAQTTPRFPARARRAEISAGSVTLEFTVDRGGAVRDARVVQADPAGVFDDAALRAIEKWRYQPKLEAGKPVDSKQRFTFRFRE